MRLMERFQSQVSHCKILTVIDEEDQIRVNFMDKKNARGKKAATKIQTKYERSVKTGFVKNDEGAEFPVSN